MDQPKKGATGGTFSRHKTESHPTRSSTLPPTTLHDDVSSSTYKVPSMDVPIPFIETSEDGKMCVNEEAQEFLLKVRSSVSAIAIVGKYRTGKSYIMNRFFDANARFRLGPTIQSTTKGIWIWVRPHPMDSSRALILLDTEGLHDVEKGDETHNIKLFTLAVLLSNCLVCNAVGTLDDVLTQELNLVTKLTENIKIKKNSDEDDDEMKFSQHFPNLFILLRDFFLDLSVNGKPCTPDEYLENALKNRPGLNKKAMEYNQPRNCIRTYFPTRRCFILCKPVGDDALLKQLDDVSEASIKPEFLAQADTATKAILTKATPMDLDYNLIDGPCYVQMTKHYVDCINNGSVPCISNTVDLLKHSQCEKALQLASSAFRSVMEAGLDQNNPTTSDNLASIQRDAHKEALACFCKESLFDKSGEYMEALTTKLEGIFQEYVEENNKKSEELCSKELQWCFTKLMDKIRKGEYVKDAYKNYRHDKQMATDEYKKVPQKGPMAEKMLALFLENRQNEEQLLIAADTALNEKQKEVAKAAAENALIEERVNAEKRNNEKLRDDLLRKEAEYMKIGDQFEKRLKENEEKLLEKNRKDMEQKEEECQRLRREGQFGQAEALQAIVLQMFRDSEREESKKQQKALDDEILKGLRLERQLELLNARSKMPKEYREEAPSTGSYSKILKPWKWKWV